jgi:hypothetical protein
VATLLALSHSLNKLGTDYLGVLFSGLNSWVLISSIGSLELSPGDLASAALIKRLPGVLHNGESLLIHILL